LVDALVAIVEPNDDRRDSAIMNTMVDVGGIEPESWRDLRPRYRRRY
jgi:hypothetical protein